MRLVFEGGYETHFEAARILEEAGLRGEFYLDSTPLVSEWPKWRTLFEAGHEIGALPLGDTCGSSGQIAHLDELGRREEIWALRQLFAELGLPIRSAAIATAKPGTPSVLADIVRRVNEEEIGAMTRDIWPQVLGAYEGVFPPATGDIVRFGEDLTGLETLQVRDLRTPALTPVGEGAGEGEFRAPRPSGERGRGLGAKP